VWIPLDAYINGTYVREGGGRDEGGERGKGGRRERGEREEGDMREDKESGRGKGQDEDMGAQVGKRKKRRGNEG
jgi:hypothetical protein